jgi:hypothetical protein
MHTRSTPKRMLVPWGACLFSFAEDLNESGLWGPVLLFVVP